MKILFVSNLYGDLSRGGAERIVEQEANALAAAGHDVVIVTAERPRAIPNGVCLPAEPWRCPPPGDAAAVQAAYDAAIGRTKKAGVPRVVRYDPKNIYFYADDFQHPIGKRLLWHILDTFNAGSAKTFAKILGLEKPDIVHTHNLMGLGFLLPTMIRADAARRRRHGAPPLRYVHTVHDVQLIHPSGLLSAVKGGTEHEAFHFAGPMQAVYVRIMRRLMDSPDVVLFPSSFLSTFHLQKGYFPRSRRVVLSNPAPAPTTVARTQPAPPSFLFVGQIEIHKGVFTLVDAWEKAGLHASQGATLMLVGDGVKAERVRSRAATVPGISVPGKLQGEALAAAYDHASYLVVPSLVIENQPTVILEAFSRGTPVIGAITGGIPEMVHEGETGFLFQPGDVDACAAALSRATTFGEWSRLSSAGRTWAAKHDINAHVQALRAAYGVA